MPRPAFQFHIPREAVDSLSENPAPTKHTPRKGAAESGRFFESVYEVVEQIPRGRVTTYGTVSEILVGRSTAARTVGWALHGLSPERADQVPWWRVINAKGRISTSCQEHTPEEQRARLEDEGVRFDPDGRINLDRFGWWG